MDKKEGPILEPEAQEDLAGFWRRVQEKMPEPVDRRPKELIEIAKKLGSGAVERTEADEAPTP